MVHWAQRAAEDAAKVPGLTVDIVASAKDNNCTAVPKIPTEFDQDYNYLHITTNNTIMGTAYRDDQIPKTNIPLVADMSSNFLGQEYAYSKFAVIYAGAQKNLAPAGLTVLVIRKDLFHSERTYWSSMTTCLAYLTLLLKPRRNQP